MSFVR